MLRNNQEENSVQGFRPISLGSLFIPGLGQIFQKKVWRGISIFLTAFILGFLIQWSFKNYGIAKITIVSLETSWLYFPLALFWLWNVIDALTLSREKPISPLLGIICGVLILFIVAWDVTDVKPERLVERFDDAKTVATNIVNPDYFSVNNNGAVEICT
jgi:presenilin-like A22 family membrane protease